MAPHKTTVVLARPPKTISEAIWDMRTKEFMESMKKKRLTGAKPTPYEDKIEKEYWAEFKARELLADREKADEKLEKEVRKMQKAKRRARWEARCSTLVKTLSALKRLVLMRKKKPAWKPLEPVYDSLGRTTLRPWELSAQPTSSSAYRSSPSVTSRVSPGRSNSQPHLH